MDAAVAPDGKFVVAGGLSTYYLEAGSGPPVVLVHGGGAGADAQGNWTGTIACLADRYKIFAPDMVGFGRSEKPPGEDFQYSQAEREAHLAAFIDALGVGPVALVGNSMGGLTALGVACDRPDLVSSLVLMGSAGLPVPMSPQLHAIIEYDFTESGMQRIVEALTGPDFVAAEGMVEYRHALSVEPGARQAYKRITDWQKANGGLLAGEARIAAVRWPTLVVAGEEGGVGPVPHTYHFLGMVTDIPGVVIPRCGHWPMIEYPELFAAIVDEFVQQVEPV